MVMLFILALSWVAVVVGLLAKSAEAASGFTFFILFLPYLSSAFVPTDTMPSVLQGIAEHQPVTPMIETIRGLLLGAGVGDNAWLAAAWFGGIAVAAFTASVALYRRRLSQ